jgi:hypothetical protein
LATPSARARSRTAGSNRSERAISAGYPAASARRCISWLASSMAAPMPLNPRHRSTIEASRRLRLGSCIAFGSIASRRLSSSSGLSTKMVHSKIASARR